MNLTKHVQDVYTENYKMLMKEKTKTMEKQKMFMNQKIQQNKDISFPQIDLQVKQNFYQKSWQDFLQLTLKFTWKHKGTRIAQTILKKNKAKGITLPNVNIYCKAEVIKIL